MAPVVVVVVRAVDVDGSTLCIVAIATYCGRCLTSIDGNRFAAACESVSSRRSFTVIY